MAVIVTGFLDIVDGKSRTFVDASLEAVRAARDHDQCRAFIVAQDPLITDRVNIFEEWASREALEGFRADGPSDDLSGMVVRFNVQEREIAD